VRVARRRRRRARNLSTVPAQTPRPWARAVVTTAVRPAGERRRPAGTLDIRTVCRKVTTTTTRTQPGGTRRARARAAYERTISSCRYDLSPRASSDRKKQRPCDTSRARALRASAASLRHRYTHFPNDINLTGFDGRRPGTVGKRLLFR